MYQKEATISHLEEILNAVLVSAKNMTDPGTVKKLSSSRDNAIEINGNDIIPWDDLSLSHGYPGVCILFGELDYMFTEDGWDIVGLSYLKRIQNYIEKNGIHNISTFSGLAGVGFAARSLSRNGTRYANFIQTINHELFTQTAVTIQVLNSNSKDVKMSDYDVIEGVTGVGRYLLLYKDDPKALELLKDILKYLVQLTKDIVIESVTVPGWFIPSKNLFLDNEKTANPIGNFNCGLSHGIPGPLALLSLALKQGVEVEGQQEAINKIGNWLISKVIDSKTLYFPTTITWEEEISQKVNTSKSRDAWCYGTPGVARSLYLAGKANNNTHFIEIAEKTFNAIFERSEEQWDLYSPTFCHGFSGLLYTAMLMENPNVKLLAEKVMSYYSKENTFGFKDIEFSSKGLKYMNKAGLLDGATGVLLTLLAYYNNRNYTDWDTLFLLN